MGIERLVAAVLVMGLIVWGASILAHPGGPTDASDAPDLSDPIFGEPLPPGEDAGKASFAGSPKDAPKDDEDVDEEKSPTKKKEGKHLKKGRDAKRVAAAEREHRDDDDHDDDDDDD